MKFYVIAQRATFNVSNNLVILFRYDYFLPQQTFTLGALKTYLIENVQITVKSSEPLVVSIYTIGYKYDLEGFVNLDAYGFGKSNHNYMIFEEGGKIGIKQQFVYRFL